MPNEFRVEGRIQREQSESTLDGLKLMAYVFDKAGSLLGSSPLDEKGNYSVAVRLRQPTDVELIVGPADMLNEIRNSSAYRKSFPANAWKAEGSQFHLKYDTLLPLSIWWPWRPVRICVSGHVRKITENGTCPVPFVKVEVFDVDREFCFWPYLRKWWQLLLDKPVIRIPELMKEPPRPIPPFPGPDPVPVLNVGAIRELRSDISLSMAEVSPQPLPPLCCGSEMFADPAAMVRINPQPEPPGITALQPAYTRVGEARLMDSSIAARLDKLTLTSKIAPWLIFPRCFYSKAKVCETTTDCNGYFNRCFNWWPLHIRHGRLRFDSRPDIIVKVTQTIDGVENVIYMDPYTSTRWNVTNAHIDLYLDNEDVVCGPGCPQQPQTEGTTTFFTRIGNDYVYDIDQVAGTYHGNGWKNIAYSGGPNRDDSLKIQAALGKGLTEAAAPYYYRLSIAPGKNPKQESFKPINSNLADTRVSKSTWKSESYSLGPNIVNGQPALYEIRNTKDYYWYWPDLIGSWATLADVPDQSLYTVRLEVFDKNGVKLTSAAIDYRDGTVAPPATLPPMPDHCDLVLHIDNKAPTITLEVLKASERCGVVKFTDIPFDITTSVTQKNGRLCSWSLHYVKGLSSSETYMDGESKEAGLSPLPRNKTNSSAPFTNGLNSTCAFSLIVDAWSHIRNGYGFVYHTRSVNAVAVEKCS